MSGEVATGGRSFSLLRCGVLRRFVTAAARRDHEGQGGDNRAEDALVSFLHLLFLPLGVRRHLTASLGLLSLREQRHEGVDPERPIRAPTRWGRRR